MSAWECLLVWFNMSPQEVERDRKHFKGRCNQLLRQIFGYGERTYQRWGNQYEKMPAQRLQTLQLYLACRMTLRAYELLDESTLKIIKGDPELPRKKRAKKH